MSDSIVARLPKGALLPLSPAEGHRPDRLRSAWRLVKSGRVQRIAATQFRVAGNVERIYHVDLAADQTCYCRDMEYRGDAIKHQCKHVLAARLASMDPALLPVIAEWIEATDVTS